ncbi:hypothetical protein BZG36_00880 [Bifiguratus adelaidae]|uniref:TFIIB-type domain-containing protein n=1 Tax=Bifiguratus adelaidae TaxID=1938954 RepID=A0A261Y5H1_9FUNG|nr:hypothetical protein BZG36_00880 [Bifiguratus adelaidae]
MDVAECPSCHKQITGTDTEHESVCDHCGYVFESSQLVNNVGFDGTSSDGKFLEQGSTTFAPTSLRVGGRTLRPENAKARRDRAYKRRYHDRLQELGTKFHLGRNDINTAARRIDFILRDHPRDVAPHFRGYLPAIMICIAAREVRRQIPLSEMASALTYDVFHFGKVYKRVSNLLLRAGMLASDTITEPEDIFTLTENICLRCIEINICDIATSPLTGWQDLRSEEKKLKLFKIASQFLLIAKISNLDQGKHAKPLAIACVIIAIISAFKISNASPYTQDSPAAVIIEHLHLEYNISARTVVQRYKELLKLLLELATKLPWTNGMRLRYNNIGSFLLDILEWSQQQGISKSNGILHQDLARYSEIIRNQWHIVDPADVVANGVKRSIYDEIDANDHKSRIQLIPFDGAISRQLPAPTANLSLKSQLSREEKITIAQRRLARVILGQETDSDEGGVFVAQAKDEILTLQHLLSQGVSKEFLTTASSRTLQQVMKNERDKLEGSLYFDPDDATRKRDLDREDVDEVDIAEEELQQYTKLT